MGISAEISKAPSGSNPAATVRVQSRHHNIRLQILVSLLLVLMTTAVYWQVVGYGFINYDDDEYVTENHQIASGVTIENIKWAFTTHYAFNWCPLTWISHMVDIELYGMNPGGHHATNVLIHIANSLLLFFLFSKMTGALGRSALLAGFFALHPLHVESVAWIAERMGGLSTFFAFLVFWGYTRYVAQPGFFRYLPVFVFFALGLMAKPWVVTLPFVLLLLDFWPLNRIRMQKAGSQPDAAAIPLLKAILEKIPLFALTAASCVVTLSVQQKVIVLPDFLPIHARVANAVVAYAVYAGKMFWPTQLAIFYPHPGMHPGWQVAGAAILLGAVTAFVIFHWRQRPWLAVGWFWYLGTLVPMIGFVQAGSHAMADRYTYIPLIGLFIMVIWGWHAAARAFGFSRLIRIAPGAAALVAMMIVSWHQVGYWKNSITLFRRAVHVTTGNFMAHRNLGIALAGEGRFEQAKSHYLKALAIHPEYAQAYNSLGFVLVCQGNSEEAASRFLKALQINPLYAEAQNNLGVVLERQGRLKRALSHYNEAVRLKPHDAKAMQNRERVLRKIKQAEE